MKILLCALLMALSTCFADICEPTPNSGIFKIICSLNKSMDSLKNAQNKAITNDISIGMQESNGINIFLGFTLTINIIVSCGSILGNYLKKNKTDKIKQEFEKMFKDLKEDIMRDNRYNRGKITDDIEDILNRFESRLKRLSNHLKD